MVAPSRPVVPYDHGLLCRSSLPYLGGWDFRQGQGCSAGVSTTPSGTVAPAAAGTAAPAATTSASTAAAAPAAMAPPARVGSYFNLKDSDGNTYRVTLEKIIDPAQAADQYSTPGNGSRFAAAVFKVTVLSGSLSSEDADNDADIVGSDGQSYTADFDAVAGYTNFDSGEIRAAQGDSVVGAVNFQVPSGVKVAKVQWTSGGFGSTVQWLISGS